MDFETATKTCVGEPAPFVGRTQQASLQDRVIAASPLIPAAALLPVFALTMFLSAGLLFAVEPMISKMALPRLGGSPNVWNTCLFFFQAVLLLGYAYAHGLTRLCGRTGQILVHLALVVPLVALALPLDFGAATVPPSGPPVLWLLGRLALVVGPPVFAISATAPLLQHWFARHDHPAAADPYFLYAASNIGSLLALLAYPLVIEPFVPLAQQASLWSCGFGVLAAGLALCAASCVLRGRREMIVPAAEVSTGTLRERLYWIALAFVPSSLLLGVTTHITTDIAAAPLFWVVPLGLYLVTFILAFAAHPPLRHALMVRLVPLLLIPIVIAAAPLVLPAVSLLGLHLAAFFAIAMVCHGELAARRPEVGRLTEFYLFLSLGGVLGGLFNAIAAPLLFPAVWEYPLMLVAACLLRPAADADRQQGLLGDLILPLALLLMLLWVRHPGAPLDLWQALLGYLLPALALLNFSRRRLRFALGVAACLLVPALSAFDGTLATARSFFGVYRVATADGGATRLLIHGTSAHGFESELPGEATLPMGYYSPEGPFGRFFAAFESHHAQRIGLIGLGTGVLGCYAKPGQSWTFYEIDPLVVRLARDSRYFHFLERCGHPNIIIGDGRLTLAAAPDANYDALVMDAFSSDSVPTHLLTREALALYRQKLAPHGVLLFHVSNRYLNLEPVVAALAADQGLDAKVMAYEPPVGGSPWRRMSAVVVAVAAKGDLDFLPAADGWRVPAPPPAGALWTDQRSDILRTIRPVF
jgi:hypothetical protein